MLTTMRLVPAILVLACAACRPEPAQSRSAPACPSIAIAEVAASSGPAKQLPTTGGAVISVLEPLILTSHDVVGAKVGQAEGRDVLELQLDQEAAARLRSYTADHVGAQLALAVDGRVRQVMRVLDPVVGDGLIVDPGNPDEVATLTHALGDGRCAER
jgi:preprotein translocase subunit SecD